MHSRNNVGNYARLFHAHLCHHQHNRIAQTLSIERHTEQPHCRRKDRQYQIGEVLIRQVSINDDRSVQFWCPEHVQDIRL